MPMGRILQTSRKATSGPPCRLVGQKHLSAFRGRERFGYLLAAVLPLPFLAGCAALPADMGPLVAAPDVSAPPSRHDAMFPSLQLNEDLLKPLKPSNDRDWAPELAVLRGPISPAIA